MAAAPPLSAKEAAREMGTDPRTLRKFLREVTPKEDHPGQGGRWVLTKGEVTKLKKAFAKWQEKNASAKAAKEETAAKDTAPTSKASKATKAPAKSRSKKAAIEEPPEIEEDLELEDLDDPDEEDLEDLELDDEDNE